ncbi:MAG: helix-turn-helix domain-containing protein [Candidatus Omnitrophota bacterium]|nr:helix-turn-helix domain-containing protein [Candidatus Omnitrophota bacterium]
MNKAKDIMNTKEVSGFLKLHPFTVNKLAREGKIPAFKIGADWRFHHKHIERWINEKIVYQQQGRERRNPGKPDSKQLL